MQIVIRHLQCFQLFERYYALWKFFQLVIVQIENGQIVLCSLEVRYSL